MSRQPDYKVLIKIERDGGKGHWREAGAAWNSRKGRISVQMDMLPLSNWTGHLLIAPFDNQDAAPANRHDEQASEFMKSREERAAEQGVNLPPDDDIPF